MKRFARKQTVFSAVHMAVSVFKNKNLQVINAYSKITVCISTVDAVFFAPKSTDWEQDDNTHALVMYI